MAKHGDWMEDVARTLVQGVSDDGERDLSTTRLVEMEEEVYKLADHLSAQLLTALLERQAEQVAEAESCPGCHGKLDPKKPQIKTMQLQRGKIHWRQPVLRCERCRRDFFPSGGGLGM